MTNKKTEIAIWNGTHPAKRTELLPALIAESGDAAQFAYDEFFHGKIRNPRTRKTYRHAVNRFLDWARSCGLGLARIAPAHVGRYLDGFSLAPATKKLHLAAIRHFFDELVVRHVVVLNPAACVRGERLQVIEGTTPEIPREQARMLLHSIDKSHVVGLRDRAVIAVLIYTAARVGAVAGLRQRDLYDSGGQLCLRFHEKAGKRREIPVRHDMQRYLSEYLTALMPESLVPETSMFLTTVRRTKQLTQNPMTAGDIGRMLKRRLRDFGFSARLSPHSFRVMVITDLLEQGVPLEDVQYLAGHADPRTTRLYDRRQRRVTRNIVERISV
ncbi:MAG: tyrosine-type recombinase/integrase [Planctomycetota bacterium]|nr:tyrosine-type recombinase/integrase [Planctomycetota bacterium]MDA1166351.1 tyrosine-type recombinase/integrase [Planctomycetota bacterium]